MVEQPDNHADPVHIDAQQEADRLVVLVEEDQHRFIRNCRWVVEASKLGISRDLWLRELHALLSYVRQWIENNPGLVSMSYATLRDGELAIFVVPASGRFDFALSDRLTELDLELAEKFRACPCDVLQSPPKPIDELRHLTDNNLAILIYGEQSGTSSQVAP